MLPLVRLSPFRRRFAGNDHLVAGSSRGGNGPRGDWALARYGRVPFGAGLGGRSLRSVASRRPPSWALPPIPRAEAPALNDIDVARHIERGHEWGCVVDLIEVEDELEEEADALA